MVEESDFYPYGGERVITDTLDNTYKFTGHERDTESGLDHTLNRQYSSNLGRWHSADRVQGRPPNPQRWNRYAYTGGNPVNRIDPNGADWLDVFLTVGYVLSDPAEIIGCMGDIVGWEPAT